MPDSGFEHQTFQPQGWETSVLSTIPRPPPKKNYSKREIIIILVLKSCIIITTKFLKRLNYFGFEILCRLNNEVTLKVVQKNKKKTLFLFLCCLMFCLKNLKISQWLDKIMYIFLIKNMIMILYVNLKWNEMKHS